VPDLRHVPELLTDLDSEEFTVRESATEQLIKLGEPIEPALREFLRSPPSPESQRRAEVAMKKLNRLNLSPEALRSLRAVEVLEQIGTREAIGVLESLANGASGARLTQEAKASVERLAKLLVPMP
jgi:HEAT repeat protein